MNDVKLIKDRRKAVVMDIGTLLVRKVRSVAFQESRNNIASQVLEHRDSSNKFVVCTRHWRMNLIDSLHSTSPDRFPRWNWVHERCRKYNISNPILCPVYGKVLRTGIAKLPDPADFAATRLNFESHKYSLASRNVRGIVPICLASVVYHMIAQKYS